MDKKLKISLAILGGIDVTVYMFTPIILASLWIIVVGNNFGSYLLFLLAGFSSLFRAIKIGFKDKLNG